MTPDHKRLMEDVHKAEQRLTMLIDTIEHVPGASTAMLGPARYNLNKCMRHIEDAIPPDEALK